MDVADSEIINSESMKDMVLNQGTLNSAKRLKFATGPKTRDVVTKFLDRGTRSTVKEKQKIFGYDTLVFGYVEKGKTQAKLSRQSGKQNVE